MEFASAPTLAESVDRDGPLPPARTVAVAGYEDGSVCVWSLG